MADNNTDPLKKFILPVTLAVALGILPPTTAATSELQTTAVSLGDVIDSIQRTRRNGGSRDDSELIVVGAIVPKEVAVWNLNPVFLWQGNYSTLKVVQYGTNKIVAKAEIIAGQNHLFYNNIKDSQPFEPGKGYFWRLSNSETSAEISFRIMEQSERTTIKTELTAIETKLTAQLADVKCSPDSISVTRMAFFLAKGLWADAFREVYAVPKPSEDILALRKSIEAQDYC